jgi:hypothetical protein
VSLPSRLNQASFNVIWYGDSKHPRTECPTDQQFADMTLTQDEVIRIRILEPISLVDQHGQHHDMTALMKLLGELACRSGHWLRWRLSAGKGSRSLR